MMVASVSALTDAGAAAAYYEADDYYIGDAKAPSRWHGRGADALGLEGDVDPDTFTAMLDGRLPDGTVLGTTRHGAREHKLGWDITFSAPKSVSAMALVAGDRRLLDAHDRAVEAALDYAERHVAVTRIRDAGTGKVEKVATDNLAVATFPHFTARAAEGQQPSPQLHTHSVIFNATQDADGTWCSMESHALYRLQKSIGAVYHQQLAFEARQLGYAVTIARDSTFELDAVPLEVRQAFSGRSAQIEAKIAQSGKTRETASAAQKAMAALDTRAPKESVDHATLVASWRDQADRLGFTEDMRRALVADPLTPGMRQRQLAADQAVTFAVAHLSERDSVFATALLERTAGDAARGKAMPSDILAAIARAEQRQDIMVRAAPGGTKGAIGFATREAVATEHSMLGLEAQGRARFQPLHDRFEAARIVAAAELRARDRGLSWTQGQRDATLGLLQSSAFVTGIQGSAGTAKTTTVLKTYADAARDQGLEVHALAPTATAADVLGRAIGAEGMTVAMFLARAHEAGTGPRVYVVDEASMLGARDTERLLARAHETGSRLVLVGDVDQLGSVEAGRAFGQLQQAGMPTFKLDEIVRQTNEHTREAVLAILAGEAAQALDALDRGGGAVVEHAEQDVRHAVIARDFAALAPEERAGTLVLDPTREGRRQLTDAIRHALVRDGTLGDKALVATVLEARSLSGAEARDAASYEPGDIVTFRRGNRDERLKKDIGYRVAHVDAEAGIVRLRGPRGGSVDWNPERWGGDQAEAFAETTQEFRSGDRLQFTRNNYPAGRRNGTMATVAAIDTEKGAMTVALDDGSEQMLDFRRVADRHVRSGWVRTIHSAQGATAERVMAHVEAFRANTVDTRSVYVAISRARSSAALYTDSRARLTEALGLRDGAQHGALDQIMKQQREGAAIAM